MSSKSMPGMEPCQAGSRPVWPQQVQTVAEDQMNRNPLNLNKSDDELPATESSPADFPLGSIQSRAAARALLQTKAPRLSQSVQFDEDADVVYRIVCEYFDATMDPTYHEVEPTEVYARGKELHDSRHGPIIPFHLDEHAKRSTFASW